MPKTFVELRDDIEVELADSSNVLWTAAELATQMEEALREISEYAPVLVKHEMELESRTGKASATTANELVDSTEAQFLATDVDKVVWNVTDRTWAYVTAYVTTSRLTISKDIMAINEEYKLFNRDCWNNRQLYLGNIEDYVGPNRGVVDVEYRIQKNPRQLRNFVVEGNILTLLTDFEPADSKAVDAAIEVFVWVAHRHQVSQLTDLAGAVDLVAGYAADTTTIHVDTLAATEVIAEDQEFTIAGLRGTYRTTAATTLAANEGDITFWPPLKEAIVDNDVVTFLGSTLSRPQERIFVDLVAGRAAMSKGAQLLRLANTAINAVNVGGQGVPNEYGARSTELTTWGREKVALALRELKQGIKPRQFRRYSRD